MLAAPKQPSNPKLFTREVPPYPEVQRRFPPRLPDLKESQRTSNDLDTDINIDFEENSYISVTHWKIQVFQGFQVNWCPLGN